MTAVTLDQITKQFGDIIALNSVDLQIAAGELFFLLGPSGCGKSTLLRLIAGLHEPSSGRILFNDRDVTALGTGERNAVMCFQSYALWPHMSVRENVRFGLSVKRMRGSEAATRVDEVLQLVRMEKFSDRRPGQLSGGQQQRVALARALAVQPDCLLLDEPLSNLDATLRLEMRTEIRRICRSSGATTIYVTHDQKEALSVADRIAVMLDGRVVQVGAPLDLYQRPVNSFVAGFLGQTNLIKGVVAQSTDDGVLRIDSELGPILAASVNNGTLSAGSAAVLSIRPERLRIGPGKDLGRNVNRISARRVSDTFLGESSEHTVRVKDQDLMLITTPPLMLSSDDVTIEFDPADVVVLPE